MVELTYAELTQGRESTRLPYTHKFTSLKNIVISALHKLTNIYSSLNAIVEERVCKKQFIMVVWCNLKVPSLRITVRHYSARLAMLNSYRRDRILNLQLIAIKILKRKKMCHVRTFVTYEYEKLFVHTDITYENVIWSNLCYAQKYDS